MEDLLDIKVPGVGCSKHVTEVLENALFRSEFGKTTSPEEVCVKKTKTWFNETLDKNLEQVMKKKNPISE